MYADFEKRVHAFAEQGHPLTLDLLTETFGQMSRDYMPGVVVDDSVAGRWMRIPHFYRAFYVYQYATGMSAAIAVASMLRDESEPARQRYLQMLEAGGSDYPLNLLKEAGIDLTTPEPVKLALKEFGTIIDEMERLEAEGVLARAQEKETTTA
jgi:oligoendopeptidase F